MAVTGGILAGYLIAHMAGNLQFFAGRDSINRYAEALRSLPGLLWGVRLILLASVILHIVVSVQLAALQRAARPIGYVRKKSVGSSYASRTMMWSGPIIAIFIVYHLLHLTTGTVHPDFEDVRPYENLVAGFSQPLVAIVYIVAMGMIGLHLYHGV